MPLWATADHYARLATAALDRHVGPTAAHPVTCHSVSTWVDALHGYVRRALVRLDDVRLDDVAYSYDVELVDARGTAVPEAVVRPRVVDRVTWLLTAMANVDEVRSVEGIDVRVCGDDIEGCRDMISPHDVLVTVPPRVRPLHRAQPLIGECNIR